MSEERPKIVFVEPSGQAYTITLPHFDPVTLVWPDGSEMTVTHRRPVPRDLPSNWTPAIGDLVSATTPLGEVVTGRIDALNSRYASITPGPGIASTAIVHLAAMTRLEVSHETD